AGRERGDDRRPVWHRRLRAAGRQSDGDRSALGRRRDPVAVRAGGGEADQLAGSEVAALAVVSAPSPRSSRGEGWGEGLYPQILIRGESPSPEAFGHKPRLCVGVLKNGRRRRPTLSPQAGRGEVTRCRDLPGTDPVSAAPGDPTK